MTSLALGSRPGSQHQDWVPTHGEGSFSNVYHSILTFIIFISQKNLLHHWFSCGALLANFVPPRQPPVVFEDLSVTLKTMASVSIRWQSGQLHPILQCNIPYPPTSKIIHLQRSIFLRINDSSSKRFNFKHMGKNCKEHHLALLLTSSSYDATLHVPEALFPDWQSKRSVCCVSGWKCLFPIDCYYAVRKID